MKEEITFKELLNAALTQGQTMQTILNDISILNKLKKIVNKRKGNRND